MLNLTLTLPFKFAVFICITVLLVGCGKAHKEAEVDGKLIINGKPAPKVHVIFIPNSEKGAKGPTAIGDTDSAGEFILKIRDRDGSNERMTATVGWNRVVLQDLQHAESGMEKRGAAIRFDPSYCLPGSTTLEHEVQEGKQSIEIKIQ